MRSSPYWPTRTRPGMSIARARNSTGRPLTTATVETTPTRRPSASRAGGRTRAASGSSTIAEIEPSKSTRTADSCGRAASGSSGAGSPTRALLPYEDDAVHVLRLRQRRIRERFDGRTGADVALELHRFLVEIRFALHGGAPARVRIGGLRQLISERSQLVGHVAGGTRGRAGVEHDDAHLS